MLRAAVRPRMLVMLVVLLAAAAVCARLGVWQLDRAQARGAQAERAEVAVTEGAAPVPLADVLAPQTSFTADLLGRHVSVTGTYEPAGQLLVTDRALDGRDGFLVLTSLRVSTGDGDGGPVLPVARGWVASPDDAGEPPAGEVTLTGFLQASEAAGRLDAEAGRVEAISSAQLVNLWGGPIYAGYLVVADASPEESGLRLLPPPEPRGGGGWDLRNLGYALQWSIFGLFAAVLWLRLVRDEARGELPPGAGGGAVGGGAVGDRAVGDSAVGDSGVGGDAVAGSAVGGGAADVRTQAGADASP